MHALVKHTTFNPTFFVCLSRVCSVNLGTKLSSVQIFFLERTHILMALSIVYKIGCETCVLLSK